MARPKEFDPDVALDKAMHLFWSKGYCDTSIRDLVEHTGVNYYGLYDVFDSKHGLFVASLDRYARLFADNVLSQLNNRGTPRQRIRSTFDALLKLLKSNNTHEGCMMCNAMVELAPHDPDIAAVVSENRNRITKALATVLAETYGTKAKPLNIKASAEFLATTVFSVGLMLRAGAPVAQARRYIDTALSILV